jgi:glutamate-1-semialdehyde 2,1-aminomutase
MERSGADLVADVPAGLTVNRVGSMATIFFTGNPVRNYEEAKLSDTAQFGRFFHYLLDRGIYFPPSQFEAAFLSAVHTAEDIAYTRRAIADFAREAAA